MNTEILKNALFLKANGTTAIFQMMGWYLRLDMMTRV